MTTSNIIERLEKISAKLFQESLKTYTFKDVTMARRATPHHLVEMLSFYPNKGVGFVAWRKGWSQNSKIRVTSTEFKSNRHGFARGMMYFKGGQLWKQPKRIPGQHKRGLWCYDVTQAKPVTLDNGLVYTVQDYLAYQNLHKSYSKYVPQEPQEGQAQPSVQAQAEVQVQGEQNK